jgi:6-phosphogluconolactonase (cycloisomerase 2 family)
MRAVTRIGTAALAIAVVAAGAGGSQSALAAGPAPNTVFVQNDDTSANQVVVYDRSGAGALTQAGIYDTGGLGGQLEGSEVDHLGSQGSLALDAEDGLLYAVNAGSDTISVFAVLGDRLALRQVLSSGGAFPVSVAVRDGLVYVLNALEGGSLQGFDVQEGRLVPIAGSDRALGLPAEKPLFTHTPGQLAFSPDGTQLIVTTKETGDDVDVFAVNAQGRLSRSPIANPLPGTVPFAVTFDKLGNLIVSESAGAIASFKLEEDGTIEQLDSVPSGQVATCWVVGVRDLLFTSNPGSASLSAFQSSDGGQLLTPLGDTETDPGTVDATITGVGRFLYVQAGGPGDVDEFALGAGGALTRLGSVTVPDAVGGEGIAAPVN